MYNMMTLVNTEDNMVYLKVAKRVNPQCSECKEKNFIVTIREDEY